MGRLDDGVDAVDEVLGADGHQDGHEHEGDAGGDGLEDVSVLASVGVGILASLLVIIGRLLIEEAGVGLELEEEIEEVEHEEDDGGAVREEQDLVLRAVLALARVADRGIEGGGDDERGARDRHEGRHGLCSSHVKVALALLDATCNEAAAQYLRETVVLAHAGMGPHDIHEASTPAGCWRGCCQACCSARS